MYGFSQAISRTKSHLNFKLNHGECLCSLEVPLMTSWTDSNPERRFYGCGMYELVGQKRCGHFVWYDEEITPRAKEMITSLKEKLCSEQNKVNECRVKEDELKMKIKFLNMQMKFSCVMSFVMLLGLIVSSVMK
ncbi:unnamed protein product [Lathyrus sativus]|nr:unnamed protein product [Lathyrus sativus]